MGKIKVPFVSCELILAAHEGGMFSMGEILGRYGGAVESYLRTRYGFLSDEAIKDCRQEMSIALFKAVKEFKPCK